MRSKVLAVFAFTLLVSLTYAAGNAPKPTICDRACWGATSSSCSTNISSLNRAIVHHTAGASDYNVSSLTESKAKVRGVQSYHKSIGWCDIGYHFLVDKLGNAFEGRVRSMTQLVKGAHDGVNYNSFGFSCLGYFHTPYNHAATSAMRNRLYDVVAWRIPNPFTGFGSGTYNSRTVGFIAGHRNVSSTACPGDIVYAYIGTNYSGGEMRLGVNQRIVGGSVTITRDNSSSYFSASSNWWTGSFGSPYGSNYHVRGTGAVSDAATWTIGTITSPGNYAVSAWWTDGSNRASSAPYIIKRGDTTTTTVNVNQRVNGGKWNSLGTLYFWEGTNRNIKLSCWTSSGDVVIADAVRIAK